jgi:hypothetical protein
MPHNHCKLTKCKYVKGIQQDAFTRHKYLKGMQQYAFTRCKYFIGIQQDAFKGIWTPSELCSTTVEVTCKSQNHTLLTRTTKER